jgi:hypothetical protein
MALIHSPLGRGRKNAHHRTVRIELQAEERELSVLHRQREGQELG